MPDGSLEAPNSHLNYTEIADIARNAARDEVSKSYGRDWWRKQFDRWDTMNDILKRVDDKMESKIPIVASRLIDEFVVSKLSHHISKEMEIYFPVFVSKNELIQSHLQSHIVDISCLIDRKKEGVIAEISKTARLTADDMARTDQFGMIYKSIVSNTRQYIVEQSRSTQQSIVSQMDTELHKTRLEREALMKELNLTKLQLTQSLQEQRKFRWMAGSSFVFSCISIIGVTAVYINQK